MIGLLFLLEAFVLIIVWIKYMIVLFKSSKQRLLHQRDKPRRLGNILIYSGTIIGVIIPRIMNVRYDLSTQAQVTYLLITLIGVIVAVLGFQFVTAAYKTEEEAPQWVNWILRFWK